MPAEIESFFYLARKTSASEKPAFFSKQLSSRGAAWPPWKGAGSAPQRGQSSCGGCRRARPLCLPTKKRISRREIRFRRTAAIAPPRSSPAFYRILRRLEIASARAAAPKIAASVAGSGTCVIETERAFPPNRSSYKNPSGPITETEASFAPKSEDS